MLESSGAVHNGGKNEYNVLEDNLLVVSKLLEIQLAVYDDSV